MERLINLFDKPKPWIIELDNRSLYNEPILGDDNKYHYIYCWVNMDTQWCYIGKHSSNNAYNEENYLGSSWNRHYMASRKHHQFKCLILSYAINEIEALKLESIILDECIINNYSEKGLFNLNAGGAGSYYAAQKKSRELYPEHNGITEECLSAAHIRLKELYPATNGMPIECIEAVKARTHESIMNSLETKRINYKDNPEFYNGVIHKSACILGSKAHSINSIIRTINNYIQHLKDNNYEVTPYNYYFNTYAGRSMWYQHIPRILSRLDELKSHPDWTDEMTNIFEHIIPNPDQTAKGSNKFIII